MDTNINVKGTFEVKGGGGASGAVSRGGRAATSATAGLPEGAVMGGPDIIGGATIKEEKRLQLQAVKMRLKNAKTEENVFKSLMNALGKTGAIPPQAAKVAGGLMGGGGATGAGAAAAGGAAALGIGAAVALLAIIVKKMMENSEVIKAIKLIIDSSLGFIYDTLLMSLVILSQTLAMSGKVNEYLTEIRDDINDNVEMVVGAFEKMGAGILDGLRILGNMLQASWDWVMSAWDGITEKVMYVFDTSYDVVMGIKDAVTRFVSDIVEQPGKYMDALQNAISKGTAWLGTLGTDILAGITSGIDTAIAGFSSGLEKGTTLFTSGLTTVISTITAPFDLLGTALGKLDFSPLTAFLNLDFSKVMDFFKLGDDFKKASDFVKSLTSPLSSVSSGGGSVGGVLSNVWDAIT